MSKETKVGELRLDWNEETKVGEARVDGKLLFKFPDTPAMRFVLQQMSARKSFNQAWIDLMYSNVPIDTWSRRFIARALEELWFPPSKSLRKDWQQFRTMQIFDHVKSTLKEVGWPAMKAEVRAAKFVGMSIDAINKRKHRAKSQRTNRRAR
jgi:hypothetical protein